MLNYLSGFELYFRWVPLKTEPVVMRGRRRQGKDRLKSDFAVFDLHRDYCNSLSLSNVCEFSWCWIPKSRVQKKKERKFCRCMFTSSIKHYLFSRHCRRSATSFCFAYHETYCFRRRSRCRHRRRILSSSLTLNSCKA